MKKPIIIIIVVAILGAAGGYYLLSSKDSSPEIGQSINQSVSSTDARNSNNGSLEIKDEELEGALVDSFPESKVPLYPGDITSSSGRMAEYLNKPEWSVDITTTDAFSDVDASIRGAYSSNGWRIVSDNKGGLGGFMLVAHSDDHIVTITYYDLNDPVTDINYGVSAK